jgi:cytidylate kinase
MAYICCYKIVKIMDKELEKKLKEYAEKRANDVYDIDIDELRQLVIDGAKWMLEQQGK